MMNEIIFLLSEKAISPSANRSRFHYTFSDHHPSRMIVHNSNYVNSILANKWRNGYAFLILSKQNATFRSNKLFSHTTDTLPIELIPVSSITFMSISHKWMRNSFRTINLYDVFAGLSFHFFVSTYIVYVSQPASRKMREILKWVFCRFFSFLFLPLNKKINFFLFFCLAKIYRIATF